MTQISLACVGSQGRRFLSFVLSLHPTLIRDAHAVIKAALPGAPAKTVEAYGYACSRCSASDATVIGLLNAVCMFVCVCVPSLFSEILFRAWRSSDGPCVLALEHVVMQDYMQVRKNSCVSC